MKCEITSAVFALAVMGCMAIAARGEAVSGTLSGDSTLTPTATPGVYVQNFTGDGNDATFGAFTPTSTSTIDFSHPPSITLSDGSLSEVFTNGTLFGTTSGSGTANGQGKATVTVDFVITGGTGLFIGASGDVTISGTITQTSPTTESVEATYVGTVDVPTTPLPASGIQAGVLIGIVAAGMGLKRLKTAFV